MLEQITELGIPESGESLTMTTVVAPCADVSRPTLPNLDAERVNLDIAEEIIENDFQILKSTTFLFRTWMQSITGGLTINLNVQILEGCTTVDYFTTPDLIFSYPDSESMIDAVPTQIASETDIWWVIAPSGVPGDGSRFNREFITGGMGTYGSDNLPVFISNDMWFIRKPAHLGVGEYHEVERLAYHPQWFQHEFMHHLYREWPQFGLEETGHQWFDRSTWPEDFEGIFESDYYSESITKRFLDAIPSLAERLKAAGK